MPPHGLTRQLNFKNIRLADDTVGKAQVGVMLKSGKIRLMSWQGFMDRQEAISRLDAKPVLLKIKRVNGDDLEEDDFVQGCLTIEGAYALIDSTVDIVKKSVSHNASAESR